MAGPSGKKKQKRGENREQLKRTPKQGYKHKQARKQTNKQYIIGKGSGLIVVTYRTPKTVFHHIFDRREGTCTYQAVRRILTNSLNSLIIHQVRTKEITTVKEVCIPGLNYNKFWRFYFSVYLAFVSIAKIYLTRETVFHRLSKHLEFDQKYSAARSIFNSLLRVWISRWNTVSRVWYITSNTILTFEISSWSSSRLNARREIPNLCAPCIILYWFLQLQYTTWYHWIILFCNVCVISPGLSLMFYPMLPPFFLTFLTWKSLIKFLRQNVLSGVN